MEPRTFRARMVMLEIKRPLSAREIAGLMGLSSRQAWEAVDSLIRQNLARRVGGGTRYRYEAVEQ